MISAGIYRGICIDARDPQGLGRVRVSVPQVLGPHASGWAFPAWSLADLSIWPEDRMPQPGQGVWVAFESADRMTWLATFGPQQFSDQRFDAVKDPVTGLPVAYETSLVWDLPVLPPEVAVPIAGSLMSPSGLPQPEPDITVAKHPPGAEPDVEPDSGSGDWQVIGTVKVDSDGSWSLDYTRDSGEEDWWYRATYAGLVPFWPATAGPSQVPIPARRSVISWDAEVGDFQWQSGTVITGTLLDDLGRPINGHEVRLYQRVSGSWASVATAVVGRDGGWTASWFWPKALVDGFEIRAMYLGSDDYDFDMTDTLAVPAVSVPVVVTMRAPTQPEFGAAGRFTGTVGTARYGVPEEVRSLSLQVMPLVPPSGRGEAQAEQWVDVAQIRAGADGRWQVDHVFAEPYADYRVKHYANGVYQDALSGAEKILLELDTSVTAPVLPSIVVGFGFSATGTVRDENGAVAASGECALMYRFASETEDDWRESAAPRSPLGVGGQYLLNHPPVDLLGTALWRVDFLGSGHLLPATSTAVARTSGLGAVSALSKGAVTHTSAAVSWTAVPGATEYRLWRDVEDLGLFPASALSYTFSGLANSTTYGFRVQASALDVDGSRVSGSFSPVSRMSTGRPEARKSGSLLYEANPSGAGTYRGPDGWSYNGNDIVQGYYSNSSYTGYGVLTYDGAGFRSWVANTYGNDVLANLVFNETSIYLIRNTTSYTGGGPAVSIWWWVSSAVAHQGGWPAIAGGEATSGLERGASGWKTLPSPWWGGHVLLNETIGFGVGTVRSFVIHRNNSVEYSKYLTANNGGRIRVRCSWNFVTVPYVAPKWL